MRKKKLLILIVAVIMSLSMAAVALSGCSMFGRGKINDFADELFPSLFTNDALSANFFFEDADSYLGLKPNPSLSTPSTKDEYQSNHNAMKTQALLMASMFRYSKMSAEEKELFDFLQGFFVTQSTFADYYYLQDDYIGGHAGMQANLPIYLTEYKFRDKQDIEDYLTLCRLTASVFPTWVAYEQARLDNGFGRMKVVLMIAVNQCESFTGVQIFDAAVNPDPNNPEHTQTENFVLKDAIGKLSRCGFLSETEKSTYESSLRTAVNNQLIPSYIKLGIDIKELIQKESNQHKFKNGGLAVYGDAGRNYYQALFNYSTGTADGVTVAYSNTVAAYNQTLAEIERLQGLLMTKLNTQSIDQIEAALGNLFTTDESNWTGTALNSTLLQLKNKLSANFPAMAETSGKITTKIIDESLKDYYSPAAYFVSPLDNKNSDEVIVINNWDSTGYLSYDLLSHEGIPGHLYQYNYLKNSDKKDIVKVLCPLAYKEGWATYAEHYMANYYGENDSVERLLMQYQVKKVLAKGYIRVMSDILINYNGYDTQTLTDWLTGPEASGKLNISAREYLLPYGESGAHILPEDFANTLAINSVLSPCNAATYYYSYLQVNNIINALKAKGYSDHDAHKAFLDSPYTFVQIKQKFGI